MEYDFKSLSDYDFELLVCDLLSEQLGRRIESFRRGRDQGVDLRYASDSGGTVVVQCKHYANTPFSGLCAAAKNPYAASVLNRSGSISKVYYAVTEGMPFPHEVSSRGAPIMWYEDNGSYVIDAPIGRAEASVVRREVRRGGRRAVTRYTILKGNRELCLVRVMLETGRTHQIRVHFSSVGHPLAGDDFYGGSTKLCCEQALHCGEMRFARLSDGAEVELSCGIRRDMELLL